MKLEYSKIREEAMQLVQQLFDEHEQLHELDLMTKVFQEKDIKDWTADELSRYAVRMSAYLPALADECTNNITEYRYKYFYRKYRKAEEYNNLRNDIDTKVKDAEIISDQNVKQEYEQEILAQHIADFLKGRYDSYNTLIMTVMNRLNMIRDDMVRSKSRNTRPV